ncbi:MAG TPA: hypothetical protein VK512_14005 [Xanthobacteraceae bacterium]|nr:hypothetical protein [Xanthobacteraceae bacterium]
MKTVRELIEELQKIPGDYEVQVLGQGGSEGCPCIPELEVDAATARSRGLVTIVDIESIW